MHPIKIVWALRGLIYSPFFKKIGFGGYFGKPLFLSGIRRITIGSRTRIFPGMRMEAIGEGSISIGSNTVIEQNAHIISMGSSLKIGNDVTIAPNVFISNVNHKYTDIGQSVMDQGYLLDKTEIGDSCFLGYGSVILPGTILDNHCIVGANSVVKGVFPAYSVIVGSPARIVSKYNTETEKWEKA